MDLRKSVNEHNQLALHIKQQQAENQFTCLARLALLQYKSSQVEESNLIVCGCGDEGLNFGWLARARRLARSPLGLYRIIY